MKNTYLCTTLTNTSNKNTITKANQVDPQQNSNKKCPTLKLIKIRKVRVAGRSKIKNQLNKIWNNNTNLQVKNPCLNTKTVENKEDTQKKKDIKKTKKETLPITRK